LLPAFEWAVARLDSDLTPDDATLALAAFHTAFNVAGVILVLPFSRRFAALVERLIKDRGPQLTRNLDPSVAGMGAIAIEAVRGTAHEIAGVAFAALRDILRAGQSARAAVLQLQAAATAQRDAIAYLARIRVIEQLSEAEHDRHLSTIHALDHLGRLIEDALAADTKTFAATPQLRETVAHVDAQLEAVLAWEADRHEPAPVDILRHAAERVAEERLRHRAEVLARVARGQVDPGAAEAQIEAMRWLNEIAHSLYRIADHLSGQRALGQAPEAPTSRDGETHPSLPPL
jgi:phosphate:Na+ symporter